MVVRAAALGVAPASVDAVVSRVVAADDADFSDVSEAAYEFIPGYGCEDRYALQFRPASTGSPESEPNNLATHLTMLPNSRGGIIVRKIDQCPEDPEGGGASGPCRVPITPREVWELAEYRFLLSNKGLVSDRIHRANMQRREALAVMQDSKYQVLDQL